MITKGRMGLLAGGCSMLLAAAAQAAEPASYNTVEELVVTSQRAAQARAVDAKRAAGAIVEVISATDVGKLPDQNVAEALRRLPAISVANDQGEGRYVIIRGVNPNLANVTINGATAAVPEPEGRQIKLDDVPSSLIGKVEVSKSLTADRDANAIAGQVDIQTLSAFDRNKPFLYARGASGRFDLDGKHPYEGDVTAGGTFAGGTFGAVVSANYSKRPIESQNFGASGPAFQVVNGFTVPTLQEVRDYNLVRKRTGLTANFDYRPNDAVQLYLRTLYSKFTDNETRDRFRIDNESGFTGQTATTGTFKGRGVAYVRRREEDDKTKTLLAGGKFRTAIGELTAEAGYSRAEKKDPLRSEVQFRTGGSALTVTYDLSDPLYVFTPSANFFDPAAYTSFNSVNYDRRKAVDTLKQARVDLVTPLDAWGSGSTVKVGAKILDRNKTNARDFVTYGGGTTAPTLAAAFLPAGVTLYDGRYTLGPRVDYAAFQALVAANPALLKLNVAGSVGNSLVNDYDANEKVYAAYAMATVKLDKLTLIPGVRVERTKGDYKAKTVTPTSTATDGYNVAGKFAYTDVFPGVNLRYDASDALVLRGAATTAIGRPNFADLAPFVSVDPSGTGTVSLGNPGLKPLKSVNLDGAVEYYLPGHGLASVSAFYKDVQDPIFSTVRLPGAGETFSGVTVPATAQVTQPVNASKAKIKGVEFNLTAPFVFLPAPFDGLGFTANASLIDAHAEGYAQRSGKIPLALQSDKVATAQLFYEKAGFQARVAWSYRSRYLLALGPTPADDQYVASHHQWDARTSYTLGPATVFLEGTNLNDEPYRIYLGDKARVIENERYGYTVRTGVQLAF
jgi:TonB-dependent receptor